MEMKRRIKRYPAAHQLDEYSNENMQVRMLRLLGLSVPQLWQTTEQLGIASLKSSADEPQN
jgi:hypothetical protein